METHMNVKGRNTDFITNADLDRLADINPGVTWTLDEIGMIKAYDKIGRSKLYRVVDVIAAFENSPSDYLKRGAAKLREALQKE
jgi:hypothetical protein